MFNTTGPMSRYRAKNNHHNLNKTQNLKNRNKPTNPLTKPQNKKRGYEKPFGCDWKDEKQCYQMATSISKASEFYPLEPFCNNSLSATLSHQIFSHQRL